MKSIIVIPARMGSTRFPNKPLAPICGMTMIERVINIAKQSKLATNVVVATDSLELKKVVERHVEVVMTSSECKTGSDRVAEVAKQLGPAYEIFFSLQGDAVLTPPWIIDDVLRAMIDVPSRTLATPAIRLEGHAKSDFIQSKKQGSTTGTCVVFDNNLKALYFSKALLPASRNSEDTEIYRHIGLYAYRRDTLLDFAKLPQSKLERSEQLEQLRALEHGLPIHIVSVNYKGRTHGSVDNPEDILIVENIIAKEGELII